MLHVVVVAAVVIMSCVFFEDFSANPLLLEKMSCKGMCVRRAVRHAVTVWHMCVRETVSTHFDSIARPVTLALSNQNKNEVRRNL